MDVKNIIAIVVALIAGYLVAMFAYKFTRKVAAG